MSGFFGSADADVFTDWGTFVPENVPTPGGFLADDEVRLLIDDEHVRVHELSRELFEERGVYDVTFGYNLAKLNHDRRHPDAGFRYAEQPDGVLRAEFTPTTAFCPQSDTLTLGAFRAWNGLLERHGYTLVRVRVASMHQRAREINGKLREFEETLRETGELPSRTETGERSTPF